MTETNRATRFHQFLVTGMVVLAVAIMFNVVPQLSSVPAELERRFEATYLNLIYAAYAGVLALVVVWRVGHRPEAQSAGLLLGFAALLYASSVTPSGEAGPVGRWLIALCVAGLLPMTIRFWYVFPEKLEQKEVLALDAERRGRSWIDLFNRATSFAVAKTLGSWWVKGAYAVAVLIFAHQISAPGSYSYAIFLRNAQVSEEMLLNGFGLPAVLLSGAFAWTSYRLSDAVQRRRVLWILFAGLVTGLWVTAAVVLGWLAGFEESGLISAIAPIVVDWYQPATSAINLTGFALGIFLSGAFDLRPLIGKTTVVTVVFIALTVLFAGVEELVESQLVERLSLSDGIGTWIGAAFVALAVGPLQTKINEVVKRIGARLEPSESGDENHVAAEA